MNGYVLAEKSHRGVVYKAIVIGNDLVLCLEDIPIKRVNAWHYDKHSAEALLCLELAQRISNSH